MFVGTCMVLCVFFKLRKQYFLLSSTCSVFLYCVNLALEIINNHILNVQSNGETGFMLMSFLFLFHYNEEFVLTSDSILSWIVIIDL